MNKLKSSLGKVALTLLMKSVFNSDNTQARYMKMTRLRKIVTKIFRWELPFFLLSPNIAIITSVAIFSPATVAQPTQACFLNAPPSTVDDWVLSEDWRLTFTTSSAPNFATESQVIAWATANLESDGYTLFGQPTQWWSDSRDWRDGYDGWNDEHSSTYYWTRRNCTPSEGSRTCPLVQPKPTYECEKSAGRPHCPAGNPINIATGNKYQREVDLTSAGPFMLSLSRFYNSSDGLWRFSYDQRIVFNEISDPNKAWVVRSDGKTFEFLYSDEWKGDADALERLEQNVDGFAWKFTKEDGEVEYYDNEGHLAQIKTLQGHIYALNHDEIAFTTTVTDSVGNTLFKQKNADGFVTQADINGVESVTYIYDSQDRLVEAQRESGTVTRQYHYEDFRFPHHLTGITDERGVRFATWAYDQKGRGILSEHVGQERAELVFNANDSTTVTNSLGKDTTYHFAEIEGLRRVTQVEGHASTNCTAANKNYTYHPSGMLETKTDWKNNTTSYQYNTRNLESSRTEALGTPQERTITTEWHPTFNLRTKVTEPGKETVFTYDEEGRLQSQASNELPLP